MLKARNYNGKAIIKFIEEKMDGHRVYISKTKSSITAITRSDCDIWPSLQGISFADKIRSLPDSTELDCELYAIGRQATDVKTMINDHDPALTLCPFAIPAWGGWDFRDEPYEACRAKIEELGFTPPVRRKDLETFFCLDEPLTDEDIKELKDEARRNKIEGFVLKEAHYNGWWKLKPTSTVDCFVVDYEISTSDTWAGGLKSIIVAVYDQSETLIIANVGSGFEGEFRMSVNPKNLIGKVCEVSFDSLAAKGRLKFPRFICWRDDKNILECTKEQLNV